MKTKYASYLRAPVEAGTWIFSRKTWRKFFGCNTMSTQPQLRALSRLFFTC